MSEIPYLGLRPYQEVDQHNFFGRDNDCEVLIDKVLSNRLTLLFAASGVGKSSLLNAAVLPKLKDPLGENLSVTYHNDWVQSPLSELKDTIREVVPTAWEVTAEQTLCELVSFCSLFTRHPFVLVLDQFEEFFRYQPGKADFHSVIQQLTALVTNPDIPVSVVISMREDFALELNSFKPKLPTLLFENYYRLEKMKLGAARDAIILPLAHLGYHYEPELLTRLILNLSSQNREQAKLPHITNTRDNEFVEPAYLQLVCSHLWELNKGDPEKCIRLSSYEKSGQADGIIQLFLYKIQNSFNTSEKDLASKAFDYLAAQGGVKMAYPASILSKILKVDEIKLTKVLNKLASDKVRVLRTQPREGIIWYELYHDMFSLSIERWNNDWKAKQLRRQRLFTGSFISLMGIVFVLLVDSFMWIQKNNFPANELFTQQKYRLMDLGLLPEPFPEMVAIPEPKSTVKMGELDRDWYNNLDDRSKETFGSPVVDISIEKPFQMGKFEITYYQYDYYVWKQLKSGLKQIDGKKLEYPAGSTRENARGQRAVSQVSWNMAVSYSKWLSNNSEELTYRLPTEAEWEYSARAGTKEAYWWGDNIEGDVMASCSDCSSVNENRIIQNVGTYPPNPFGLYDTAGNVWEWTCSRFNSKFDGSEQICDYISSDLRVIRGGSWKSSAESWLRSSGRSGVLTNDRNADVGFRLIGFSKTLNH